MKLVLSVLCMWESNFVVSASFNFKKKESSVFVTTNI